MPSPVRKRGNKLIYKRGKGVSVHSIALDRKRRARKGTRKQVERYPQAYD